jgi:hypothetical protein
MPLHFLLELKTLGILSVSTDKSLRSGEPGGYNFKIDFLQTYNDMTFFPCFDVGNSWSFSNILDLSYIGWRSWLRHCTASRKVAGSIPDGVTGIFQWLDHSCSTMAMVSTQVSKRNEYQETFLGGKSGRCVGLTTLLPSSANCLEILEPQPPGAPRACPGL